MSFEVWAGGIAAFGAGAAIVGALAYHKGKQAAARGKKASERATAASNAAIAQSDDAATGAPAGTEQGARTTGAREATHANPRAITQAAANRESAPEACPTSSPKLSPTGAVAAASAELHAAESPTSSSLNTALATTTERTPELSEPEGEEPTASDEHAKPTNMDELAQTLFAASNPLTELKRLVARIRKAERAAERSGEPAPSAIDLYLARALEEAGLTSPDAGTPTVSVVRPSRSRTFYLRVTDRSLSWADMLRLYAIESALNRTLFVWERLEKLRPADIPEPDLEDCYRLAQALGSSITDQLGSEPIAPASMCDIHGEWGARQAISAGIESFRLPMRLSAKFRVNLMGGDVAIVANYLPWQAFPASLWSGSLERIVPASHQMRERAATAYALRLTLLLASHAFRSSKRLCHAYVALVLDTPARHTCLVSGNISREQLREVSLEGRYDPQALCRQLGVRFELKDDALQPIAQGFSLDDERFCPATRYESVDLSHRILPRFESMLLGAERVSDLAINENAHRSEMAQLVAARALGSSCATSVRRILELTQNDKDATVREAGERTAAGLISGSLPEDDPIAFTDEFVFGDALSRACDRALDLLQHAKTSQAIEVLTDALAPIDALDTYTDTATTSWRQFSSFVGRTLYNRLLAEPGRELRLVPDSYYNAQLLMATALLMAGRTEEALGFSERAHDLNPLDMAATLRIVRCLEVQGNKHEAAGVLRRALETTYDPEGTGSAYYRLAFMEWKLGEIELADACYQKAIVSRASCSANAAFEIHAMRTTTGTEGVEPGEVDALLEVSGIPLAPTESVVEVLIEAAQAATDAEVFPVARSFASLLGALSADDVIHGVVNSLEGEPDR